MSKANPAHLVRTPSELHLHGKEGDFTRQIGVPPLTFLTYMFVPMSVGMFPHLFQNWLTAKSARSFRLTVIVHPIFIMIVWMPCVLIGLWATNVFTDSPSGAWGPAAKIMAGLPDKNMGAVLSLCLKALVDSPIVVGLVASGILAAIMSSLDSQFLCLGTMFTNDMVLHKVGSERFSDKQVLLIARSFIVGIVILTYAISLMGPANIFDLAIWSFSGFASLTPLVIAAIYWRGATKAGAYASIAVSMGLWLYFFKASGWGGEYTLAGGVMPVAICFVAGALAMFVVSLVTRKPSEETLKRFFA
jgi:SSS family solute:Na+ symporter